MRINRYTVKLVREGGVNYSLEEEIMSPAIARGIQLECFTCREVRDNNLEHKE